MLPVAKGVEELAMLDVFTMRDVFITGVIDVFTAIPKVFTTVVGVFAAAPDMFAVPDMSTVSEVFVAGMPVPWQD